MKELNDLMLDANKALPEVLRFWVYFLLGLGLSNIFLGRPLTIIIFTGIVVIETWALIVEIVRDHQEEKEREKAYQELLERSKRDGGLVQSFNEAARGLNEALNTVLYGRGEDEA